jgi:hypothetical protein
VRVQFGVDDDVLIAWFPRNPAPGEIVKLWRRTAGEDFFGELRWDGKRLGEAPFPVYGDERDAVARRIREALEPQRSALPALPGRFEWTDEGDGVQVAKHYDFVMRVREVQPGRWDAELLVEHDEGWRRWSHQEGLPHKREAKKVARQLLENYDPYRPPDGAS